MNLDPKKTSTAAPSAAKGGITTGTAESPTLVVGVGISLGGENSLQQLITNQPVGHGLAFVLIRSGDPAPADLNLTELQRQTRFTVVEAADGMQVLADRIHVMPTDKFLNVSGDRLTFHEPIACNGLHMPIDHFMCALAADRHHSCCGVLLGGIAGDGVLGLSEIHAEGGSTFVETRGSDDSPALPAWISDSNAIDALLPVAAIAETIKALVEQPSAKGCGNTAESSEFDTDLRTILELLRNRSGHDFHCYKPNTLVRRISRRMSLGRIASFAEYARFLLEHPEELQLLHKDLLIGVTEFFRQPQAWAVLEQQVVAKLIAEARPGTEIRAWVPGCSTGQEAYSLAILLAEQLAQSDLQLTVQIFATDPDEASLSIARNGLYTEAELETGISSERRARFFTQKDNCWQVNKEIREWIVFAPQNLTTDPPFSRIDLITCRNLLIYLYQQVQQKIVQQFHFSLREGGFLFLGTAETIGNQQDLFAPVSKKWRIFRRIGINRRMGIDIPLRPAGQPPAVSSQSPAAARPPRVSLATLAQQALLDRFAPACAMVDRKHHVLYVHGPVEKYLTFPTGELSTRIVDMARKGLGARLRGAIDQCIENNRPVSATARVQRGSKSVPVKTAVSPLRYPPQADGLLLITFEDRRAAVPRASRQNGEDSGLQQLEEELKITREELQSTIEQLEFSNDQLKASNEEVTAANEELQATNEELETSKEELQSLNEELNTINNRLQEKVEELEGINNDVLNLLSSTNIATIFLDKELHIRRYTPSVTRLFRLIPSDVGRPLSDVLRRFKDEVLHEDARRVLADLTTLSEEVQADDGRWYIRRITPYRTQDDRIDGVVVTFGEVTDLKRSEQRNRFLADLLERSDQPFGISYPDGTFGLVNSALERLMGYTREELKAMPSAEPLTPPEWRSIDQVKLQELLRTGQPVRYEKEYLRRDGTRVPVELLVHLMTNEQGWPLHYYSFITDLTERKKADEALRRQAALIDLSPDGIIVRKMDGTISFWNLGAEMLYGWSGQEAIGNKTHKLLQTQFPQPLEEIVKQIRRHGRWSGELRQRAKDGREIVLQSYWVAQFNSQGEVTELLESNVDVTERKRIEEALRAAHRWTANILESIGDGFFSLNREWNVTYINERGAQLIGSSRQELLGRNLWESFPEAVDSPFYQIYQKTMTRRETGSVEAFYAPLNAWYEARAYPSSEGISVFYQDVSARKQTEQAARDSEARFKLLSETAGRLLAATDPQRIINDLCREVMAYLDCQAFFNFLADERTGRLHLNTCAGVSEEEARRLEWLDFDVTLCGNAARDRKPMVANDLAESTDPRTRRVRSYGIRAYACHPLMAGDRLLGTLSFGTRTRTSFSDRDLALMKTVADQVANAMDRVALIEALQQSRDELEARVQERTAELRKTNTALKRSNRDLEDFAHVASHDLQEPLRKIQTFADRLMTVHQASLDDRARDYLTRLQRAAERMQALVLDLLRYSRIASKPEPFTLFNLGDAIEEAMLDLDVLREETGARIEIAELPDIEADRIQIRQLFHNLIGNALKYHGEHQPLVKIRVNEAADDPFWEIEVKDNGIGFDAQYLDRIFKPFQRLHGKSSRYVGTGMGLAICRRIVERHGGTITARSEPGQGARFIVKLPKWDSRQEGTR